MTSSAKWIVVAVCLTVPAALVPWAGYGDIDVELARLPLWWTYLGAAVFVLSGYDGAAIFDHVVPMARPRPGLTRGLPACGRSGDGRIRPREDLRRAVRRAERTRTHPP